MKHTAIATPENRSVPVELLRDGRGIYGVGVSDLFDYEAGAWSCGVEPEPHTFEAPLKRSDPEARLVHRHETARSCAAKDWRRL